MQELDDEHTSRRGSKFCSKAFQSTSTMVLTAAQQVSFFEDADQMGLKHSTRVYSLDDEGIENVDDLADLDDNDCDQWASNCKKPDRIQDSKMQPTSLHKSHSLCLSNPSSASRLHQN